MEFPQLGKHCSVADCKQLDFLPFQCTGCSRTFCLEHRTFAAHKCPNPPASAVVPQCPLCGQPISVGKDEDPNRKVDAHINSGCPKEAPIPTHPCSVKSCKNTELFPVVCPACGKNFCLSHRHPGDHPCEGTQSPEPAAPKPAKKTAVQLRVDSYKNEKTQKLAAQVNLMKLKSKAQGDSRVPMEKRFYLEVLFPLVTNKAPLFMVFNALWSIGKVLDQVAIAGGIPNHNNKPGADKLFLFDLKTGMQLPNDKTLEELHKNKILVSGDPVLLEKLEAVP